MRQLLVVVMCVVAFHAGCVTLIGGVIGAGVAVHHNNGIPERQPAATRGSGASLDDDEELENDASGRWSVAGSAVGGALCGFLVDAALVIVIVLMSGGPSG
jgi:hypothetical protein